uniref:Uncharacterized protein n=1 Tax=Fagus sylvatica TaxID=28930 RepID=A0A2N9EME2_FAGSY
MIEETILSRTTNPRARYCVGCTCSQNRRNGIIIVGNERKAGRLDFSSFLCPHLAFLTSEERGLSSNVLQVKLLKDKLVFLLIGDGRFRFLKWENASSVHRNVALVRRESVSCGQGSSLVWGFTKFSRTEYLKLKQENRIQPDGVNAKYFGCHGPLAYRKPGTAFLPANVVA